MLEVVRYSGCLCSAALPGRRDHARGTLIGPNRIVAVYKESDPQRPGHVAIVRPSTKRDELIDAEGPQIIQAGAHNARSTSLKQGFIHHPDAWGQQKVRYFAHKLEADMTQ